MLDIGAVRPSQTPLHIHRQVLFLGDVGGGSPAVVSSTGAQPRLMHASHVMILWDEQVALSRLFHVGDELLIYQPYIHVCDDHDTEIVHVFSEYASQQRCAFYLEYGSATVFFVTPSTAPSAPIGASLSGPSVSPLQRFTDSDHPPLAYEAIEHDFVNFALYGHVRSIRVSHGIPLMAAYFYAYYDPKTNGGSSLSSHSLSTRLAAGGAGAAAGGCSALPPTLDRAIVSRYYLVVLLELYNAVAKQTLAVEVTGENALKALRLRPGHTVFLDRLVAVDVTSPAIRTAREHGTLPASPLPSAEPTFAFQSADYTSTRSSASVPPSSVVVLCSDWGSIFGKQSVLSEDSRLTVVNTTQGLLKTSLTYESSLAATYVRAPDATRQIGMAILGRACITYAGWLVPEKDRSAQTLPRQPQYASDESCQRGHSTMFAHKACMRGVESVATPTSEVRNDDGQGSGTHHVLKFKCGFCQEIFSGTHETCQTYGALVLCLDDGSTSQPHYAVCQGETVDELLGTPAHDYSQLSLQAKAAVLQQVVGRDSRVLLSRCEQLRVAVPGHRSSHEALLLVAVAVDLRIDLLEPVDVFAAAHQLLQSLQT